VKTRFQFFAAFDFNLHRYTREHERAWFQAKSRRRAKGGADWFKWSGSDDDLVKPANKKA
jgi:hypothetical protein